MRKKGVFLIIIVLTALFVVYKFYTFNTTKKLENKIIDAISSQETIDLSKITDFNWDKLYIIQPYSDVTQVLNNEGINCPNKEYAIKLFDSISMLAFIKDNQLTQYVDLSKKYISITGKTDNPTRLSKENCTFKVSDGKILFPSTDK